MIDTYSSYFIAQFLGDLVQTLPTILLFYAPYTSKDLRWEKSRILAGLVIVYILQAFCFSLFLDTFQNHNLESFELTWIANLLYLGSIFAGTLFYFYSIQPSVKVKMLFYLFVMEYAICIYIVDQSLSRFDILPSVEMHPYNFSTFLYFLLCYTLTMPFVYRFLTSFQSKTHMVINTKKMRFLTLSLILCMVFSLVYLQMDIAINDALTVSDPENLYLTIMALCVMSLSMGCYMVYFGSVLLEDERSKMKVQLSIYEYQYDKIRGKLEEFHKTKHNIRHHMRTIYTLAKEGNVEEVCDYIEKYNDDLDAIEIVPISWNRDLNHILSYYVQLAKNKNIPMKHEVLVSKEFDIDLQDMTVLLGNALENAINAAMKCNPEDAYIHLAIKEIKNSLWISLDNSYIEENKKRDRKGYGLPSIKMIVKKYDGIIEQCRDKSGFHLHISLNIPSSKNEKT